MNSLIIFASGAGSNAQAIIDYFKSTNKAAVSLIVSNKSGAGVLDIAAKEKISTEIIDKKTFNDNKFLELLQSHNPSLIILAGFLWKIPDSIIAAFPTKMINIHPALLPQYGGKGMYGINVHNAVIAAGEKETGITIHYVNEVYDNGNIIVQVRCIVDENDSPYSVAQKVHRLEHFFFPRTIEYLLDNK